MLRDRDTDIPAAQTTEAVQMVGAVFPASTSLGNRSVARRTACVEASCLGRERRRTRATVLPMELVAT